MEGKNHKVRIAALGDLHIRETSEGAFHQLFTTISEKADVVLFAGDLTDHGSPSEAKVLAKELSSCTIPVLAVLGNHDFDYNKSDEVKKILTEAKMTILDDGETELLGIGFAGVKGFCGGFERHMLSAFGEPAIKEFVHETINEALKLENYLSRLQTSKKVVLLHYAPIIETIKGEPPEIYPFLGSSRFVEPIDNYDVSAVFHGHCDFGTPKGKTLKGIPVYNVAYPLMKRVSPDQPYALVEL